jgi:hypothetical protein
MTVVADSIDATEPKHSEIAILALFNVLEDIEARACFALSLCFFLFKSDPFSEHKPK